MSVEPWSVQHHLFWPSLPNVHINNQHCALNLPINCLRDRQSYRTVILVPLTPKSVSFKVVDHVHEEAASVSPSPLRSASMSSSSPEFPTRPHLGHNMSS
jgi:hypothetical protein